MIYEAVDFKLKAIIKAEQWEKLDEIIKIEDLDNYPLEVLSKIIFINSKYFSILSDFDAKLMNIQGDIHKGIGEYLDSLLYRLELQTKVFKLVCKFPFTGATYSAMAYFYYDKYTGNYAYLMSRSINRALKKGRVESFIHYEKLELLKKKLANSYNCAYEIYKELLDVEPKRLKDVYRFGKLLSKNAGRNDREIAKQSSNYKVKAKLLDSKIKQLEMALEQFLKVEELFGTENEKEQKRNRREYIKALYNISGVYRELSKCYRDLNIEDNILLIRKYYKEAFRYIRKVMTVNGLLIPPLSKELRREYVLKQVENKAIYSIELYDIYYRYAVLILDNYETRRKYGYLYENNIQKELLEKCFINMVEVCELKLELYFMKAKQRGGFIHEIDKLGKILYYYGNGKIEDKLTEYEKRYQQFGYKNLESFRQIKKFYMGMHYIYQNKNNIQRGIDLLTEIAEGKIKNHLYLKANTILKNFPKKLKVNI